jgi:hypothetical protein
MLPADGGISALPLILASHHRGDHALTDPMQALASDMLLSDLGEKVVDFVPTFDASQV